MLLDFCDFLVSPPAPSNRLFYKFAAIFLSGFNIVNAIYDGKTYHRICDLVKKLWSSKVFGFSVGSSPGSDKSNLRNISVKIKFCQNLGLND
jgi:hypothetical protein